MEPPTGDWGTSVQIYEPVGVLLIQITTEIDMVETDKIWITRKMADTKKLSFLGDNFPHSLEKKGPAC